MLLKNVRFITVLLGVIIAFEQMCIAGKWIDDFSDPNLWDWGGSKKSEAIILIVNDNHLHFAGQTEWAATSRKNKGLGKVQNFSLEVKFLLEHLEHIAPNGNYWRINYTAGNEETGELEGILSFEVDYTLVNIVEPDVAFVRIVRDVPTEELKKFVGVVWKLETLASAPFAYEKGIWYVLRIKANGNRYSLSIGDIVLEVEDDSVPLGWIQLDFHGRMSLNLDDFIMVGPNVPDGGPGRGRSVIPVAKLTTMWGKLKIQN